MRPLSPKDYKLLHFCVVYGDATHAKMLLESVNSQNFSFEDWPIAMVIINNNESGELPSEISDFKFKKGIDFFIMRPQKNLGYFGAAQWALGQFMHAQWTIISNSDLILGDKNFLKELKALAPVLNLGALAPEIISEISGRDQNPYMIQRPKNIKMKTLKWMFKFDLTSYLYQSLAYFKNTITKKTYKNQTFSCEIYAPHGAFIIFYENYFLKKNDFSHPPFLFGEEITVAENLRKSGLKAIYQPQLKVRHQEHQATGRIPNRKMRSFISEASQYCADRFFS